MSDVLKEIWEAARQRLRVPFVGSIVIAFIVINWQPLFYLFFAEETVTTRFNYYECHTDVWTLFIWPAVVGIAFALITLGLRPLGAFIAQFPNRWLYNIQVKEATSRAIYELKESKRKTTAEADLALARAEGNARIEEFEERKRIEAARRDQEVRREFSPEDAEDLQKQLDKMREQAKNAAENQQHNRYLNIAKELSAQAKELLVASQSPESTGNFRYFENSKDERIIANHLEIIRKNIGEKEWRLYRDALEELMRYDLIANADSRGELHDVTPNGAYVRGLLARDADNPDSSPP